MLYSSLLLNFGSEVQAVLYLSKPLSKVVVSGPVGLNKIQPQIRLFPV